MILQLKILFMKRLFLLAISLIALSCSERSVAADYIIQNAQIIDGTGKDRFVADVVVISDSIVFVGKGHNYISDQVIDGSGKVLTPGFIDPHAHGNPMNTPDFKNFIAQGITTICLGQDGSSAGVGNMNEWFESVDSLDLGVNVATLAGHGSIRRYVEVPDDGDPSEQQQEEMLQTLESALEAGAYGMSTGLEYIPGYYAKDPELLALARKVGEYDGIIMSHTRNEDDYAVDESIRELIRQGQFCRVQVSHMKVVYGKGGGQSP